MKYDTRKLERARLVKGWSMTALAREAGLNLCTVSRIEHGQRANPSSVKKVADALGLPMEEVLREDRGREDKEVA